MFVLKSKGHVDVAVSDNMMRLTTSLKHTHTHTHTLSLSIVHLGYTYNSD